MSSENVTYLTLDGITAIEGGVPIVEDGKIVSAIGVSGGSLFQDGQVAGARRFLDEIADHVESRA